VKSKEHTKKKKKKEGDAPMIDNNAGIKDTKESAY
jgi:hypothetical protein